VAVDEANGKRCPGEEECQLGKDPAHLLARPGKGETAADICPRCPLIKTKPENTPLHIAAAKYFAMEHEEEVNNGFRFNSPDALTPMQWAAIRGLSRGRAKFDEWKDEKRRNAPPGVPT
jgi:hypothetical protein